MEDIYENHLEEMAFSEEYETRVLVFKVNDHSIDNCHYCAIYDLRMFKGTRKEFDEYYESNVGYLPQKDYMAYSDPEKVNNVEHGHKDNNINYYNPNREQQKINEEKRYLKSGY